MAVGDPVWVKVTGADESEGKLSLSMKIVDQNDGADLDPNNDEAERQLPGATRWSKQCGLPVTLCLRCVVQASRKPWEHKNKAIALGAVLNTKCTRVRLL